MKVRKQIYIERWQQEALATVAKKEGKPEAQLIREALEEYLVKKAELPEDHPLSGLAGIGASGSTDGAERHDEVVYRR